MFSGRVSESWEVLGWGNGLIWFCEDSSDVGAAAGTPPPPINSARRRRR